MAKCDICGKEMTTANGCSLKMIFINGKRYIRIPHGVYGETERCNDCGAKPGRYHHLGCDNEICPVCRGQLISCGCGEIEYETPS